MRNLFAVAACALLLPACTGSSPPAPVPAGETTLLTGEAMGSAWSVKLVGNLPLAADALRVGVQQQFDAVDAALSTYRADSALSQFNAAQHGDWQQLDAELFDVLRYALQLGALSGGAYDVTVAPLVDLWGFGPAPRRVDAPSAEQIVRARALVGWQQVQIDAVGGRARRPPGVRVDLSSLGKGRGVDRVARWLESQGAHNYLIDLSGKLRAGGRNALGQPWRIAVEKPLADDPAGAPNITEAVVDLSNASIATAGDYRRYFQSGGGHFSHLIDPLGGWPIDHGTGSATVRATDCMSADAWATVLTLMPRTSALALAGRQGIAALLIVRDGEALQLLASPDWR